MPQLPAISASFTVAGPLRGTAQQAGPFTNNGTFVAQSMTAAFAWGSQPGTATIVYVGSNAPIQTGAYIQLQIGALLFCGICKSDVQDNSSGGGLIRTLQFVDLREYLQFDYIFCAFNKPYVTLVNGRREKRYWHIFPQDYDTLTKTFTPGPLMAWEIVDKLFVAPTVGTVWTYGNEQGQSLSSLMNYPVYDFDALQGKRFDAALNEICEKMGCVFALISSTVRPYNLVFTRKGYGNLPTIPDDSDNRRLGVSLSGHPTNVRVLGDRNLYQVMDVPLEPDWSSAWEKFVVFEDFADDIYKRSFSSTPDDPEGYVGRQNAMAKALVMTVGEYAGLAGGQFFDSRKFAGRWRNDMPAALYIRQLLFRAFRPAASFQFVNAKGDGSGGFMANLQVPLTSLDIADKLLCKVFQDDPTTGTLQHDTTQPCDGNGYAIIKGFQVGADLFKMVSSSQFTLDFFTNASGVWAHAPFQIDDSGEGVRFIIFDEPVILSDNLCTEVDGQVVLNANFTLRIPEARAALVFEAERFSYWVGTYPNVSRDIVENVGGLNAELVVDNNGTSYQEVLYSNNETSQHKADAIGRAILLRQYFYTEGAHKWIWNPATTAISAFGIHLTSMIDRVVIKTSPQEGTIETIDYTNERTRDVLDPEREFERRTMGNSLFPGQQELRIQSEYSKKLATAFKQLPGIRRQLSDLLNGRIGSDAPLEQVWFEKGAPSGTMPAGTVIRKKPTAIGIDAAPNTHTVATRPDQMTSDSNIFVGVTVRDGEDPQAPFNVQRTGIALVRVKGPVKANDGVGLDDGDSNDWEYLSPGGSVPVGTAKQDITDSSIKLIEVDLGVGGSGGGEVGPYVLKDVFDDYLVCGPSPTIPVGDPPIDPPLGPSTNYLGSLGTDDFEGNNVILVPAHGDVDAVLYTVQKNDTCWDSGEKWFYIFDGTNWIEMDWDNTTDIYVAKEARHRNSLIGEKILGTEYIYTYDTSFPFETWLAGFSGWFNATRASLQAGYSAPELQRITPPWTEMERIMATTSATGVMRGTADGGGVKPDETGTAVTLLIHGRTCQWGHI